MFLKFAATCVVLHVLCLRADDFDDLRQQAEQARSAHNIATACGLYQRALALHPDWADGWWSLGNLLFVSAKYPDSEDALHHFTDLRSDLAEGWGMRGMAALQAKQYPDAFAFMDKSRALPFSTIPGLQAVVLTNHAFLLTRLGRFDDALEALRPFLHGDPDADTLNALGIAALHWRLMPNEVSAADRPFTEAAGRVEYQLITSDSQAGNSAEALLRQFPNGRSVHYFAGMVFFAHDKARAEAEFAHELQLDPGNVAAQSMWAYSKFALHETSIDAVRDAREAAAADPQNAGYQYVYGILSDTLGDFPTAVAALAKAAELKPENAEYHIALATALSKAGEYAKADEERRHALDLKFGHGG